MPIGCSGTSVTDHNCTLSNISEEKKMSVTPCRKPKTALKLLFFIKIKCS